MRTTRITVAALGGTMMIGCSLAVACPPSGSFAAVGNDTTPRYFHRASLLPDGRIMVTGGARLQVFPSTTLVSLRDISFFNPVANTFSTNYMPPGGGPAVAPLLSTARCCHTQTTLHDGRVLITGGRTGAIGAGLGTTIASVEIFNPSTGVISPGPAMGSARWMHTATLLPDGRVVIAGGASWQVFDPIGNTWSEEYPLLRQRRAQAAVLLPHAAGHGAHRVLLVAGGGTGPDTLETLDPDSGASVLSSALLSVGVDDVAAARFDDGTVFIVGGQDEITGDTISLTYRYDPVTDELTPGPPVRDRPGGIADHQMLVIGQFALIFSGEQQLSMQDTELTYAGIFDAVSNDWAFVSHSITAHDDAAAVRLNDGRILLIDGGVPFFGQELPANTCEVFAPQWVLLGDVNGDGTASAGDVAAFVAILLHPSSATMAQTCAADTNGDGLIDGLDIPGFVQSMLRD